ncbi:hypothetical protein LEMLEM_LOCUS25863 [Lemmus lemmus]
MATQTVLMAVMRRSVGLSHVLRKGSANHWLPVLAPVTTSVVALLTLTRIFSTAASSPVRRASCVAFWVMSVSHTHGAVMATQTVLTPVMSSAVTPTQKLTRSPRRITPQLQGLLWPWRMRPLSGMQPLPLLGTLPEAQMPMGLLQLLGC